MTKKPRPDVEQRVETLVTWLEAYSRQLMYGAIALLVVAGGFWFYKQSNRRQAESASTALAEAQSAMAAGNLPLGYLQGWLALGMGAVTLVPLLMFIGSSLQRIRKVWNGSAGMVPL